jgi:hypothetical protein
MSFSSEGFKQVIKNYIVKKEHVQILIALIYISKYFHKHR